MAVLEQNALSGKAILVTAGPTREHIDPVRFISNPSSGKMGYAIAEAAKERGADVILISGPTQLLPPEGVNVVNILSALDLENATLEHFHKADVVVSAAAVVDYRPESYTAAKIKKGGKGLTVHFVENPDILRELGRIKSNKILVGFAAETEDLIANATAKLRSKNLNLIVANDLTVEGSGFAVDTNMVKLIRADGEIVELPRLLKTEVAKRILDEVARLLEERREE